MRNSMKKNVIKNSKLYKKSISVLLAVSLSLNAVSFDVFPGLFGDSMTEIVSAADVNYTVSNTDKERFDTQGTAFANTPTSKADFLDFCYFYQTDDDFAAKYVDATVSVGFITFPSDFMGFGNKNVKFRGDFRIQDTGNENINLPCALFTHVYDSATITNANGQLLTMKVVKTSAKSSSLVAEYVYHDNSENAISSTWNITAASDNTNPYAGVIGEMKEGAKLTLEYANRSSAIISSTSDGTESSADVGSICGKMETGSELTVSITSLSNVEISSSSGNAGGLVGTMEGTSKLVISSLSSNFAPSINASSSVENKGYAGGVVGSMLSSASVDTSALGSGAFEINGTINGTNGAGGYCGRYVNSADNAVLDLSKYNITATVSGSSSGGVFGVFENQSANYTITGGGIDENDPKIESTCSGGNYGGVIGTYKTTALSDTLYIKKMNTFANATGTLSTFGGAIGKVDSAAYIKTDTVKIKAEGANNGWFGGLVGETSANKGVFIDLADFTLDANGFTGGGVVGKFRDGVLRLSGVTDMTSASVGGTWTTVSKYGQLVGENDNVLVYAIGTGSNGTPAVFDSDGNVDTAASGWTFKRSSADSIADDLGTWGEVVRIADVETNILTLDTTAHTVTLKAAEKTMDSKEKLVLTALNIQLNQGSGYDCLLFANTSSSKRSELLKAALTISGSQSFAETGVNGFMRDGSDSIGEFTGTLTGGTVTLAIGEKYGYNVTSESTGEGLGQIYRHPYNGLFSVIGSITKVNNALPTATVNTLTVNGAIDIHNAGMSEMYIGGIGARVNGNLTLNGITASQSVSYHEDENIVGAETTGKNIGGLIGALSSSANGSTIAVTGTNEINTAFALSGQHKSWVVLGSFIGKVLSPSFTINIAQTSGHSLTDKHTTDVSNITAEGANADGGGLIGYIIRNGTYSDRIINIDNLTFNGCTISNIATTNGGGLLGYAWLETATTIGGTNGITVTDATINNSSPADVGAMCYKATGRWTINKLAVNKLEISNGAGSSLGMLVNTAYHEYTEKIGETTYTKTDGLYLDVLNSGYTYTVANITLPTSGVYDELAVYTAQNVLKGRYTSDNTTYGAGVISINMGTRSDSVVSVATTGTYQNKITTQPKPNKFARYYYNLDKMSKSDASQDVVLWSLNKYAAENIMTLFVFNADPLNKTAETNIDFTGLSFYPVYTASGDTVNNVNISFDYDGIYDAETVGSTNTDTYIRDPGAENQHYLMQSGLFIEQGESSTLTVNSTTLAGTFLEVGNYKGVLISTTSNGSVKINGLELRGITPETMGGTAYSNGYLLVNSIRRENAQKGMITLQVANVKTATDTSNQYSTQEITTGEGEEATSSTITTQVAKSLFGEVYGPGLIISFKEMKLDAREPGTLAGNTALNIAYGTRNSIFTESTFFASLKTDSLPMPYYNYTYEEDWGENGTGGTRSVTYGKEVYSSVEHKDREHMYYKSDDKFTNPTNVIAGAIYDGFGSGWLPYVKHAYTANQTPDENGCYYREIRVNISDIVTSSGCGTYNDPYIINEENEAFLVNVAAFLRDGNGQHLPNLTLPTNKDDYDTLDENTSGKRWCEDKNHHAEFEFADGNYTYTPSGGTAIIWTSDNVRLYLENAYYKVEGSITLPGGENGFVGLGGDKSNDTTGKYAFRGVIIGTNNATITNNSINPLIMISNGCVVKNVNVVQNATVTLNQYKTGNANAAFGYKIPTQKNENTTGCAYYGGIIGEIMGGDNIIDNCYVTQGTGVSITLAQTYGLVCPVGSYVGVVVYGGLIFKNMSTTDANRNSNAFRVYKSGDTSVNLNAASSKSAIYVNPYVGRVINGYAVNETTQFSVTEDGHYHDDDNTPRTAADGSALTKHSLKNTSKHYTIADLNKNETDKLDVTKVAESGEDGNGNIDVPNAQALFVLSLITQSCAGTATDKELGDYKNSLSYGKYTVSNTDYVFGMSHNAEYSAVGTNEEPTADDPATEDVDETVEIPDYTNLASYETANNTAGNAPIPYIIKRYTVGASSVQPIYSEREVPHEEIQQVPKERYTFFAPETDPYSGDVTDLDGEHIIISCTRNDTKYLKCSNLNTDGRVAQPDASVSDATKVHVVKQTNGKYRLSCDIDGTTYYLKVYVTDKNNGRGGLQLVTKDPSDFTIQNYNGKWLIYDESTDPDLFINRDKTAGFRSYKSNGNASGYDDGNQLIFNKVPKTADTYYVEETVTVIEKETYISSYRFTHNYPARCVTSTEGYYDINLTEGVDYALPDSFRGLGCVGIYDSVTATLKNNKYSMKINEFDGKDCTIDEDIYLNKFKTDNYFDVLHAGASQILSGDTITFKGNGKGGDGVTENHGIGLFDSVITKGSSYGIGNFILSGSLNTEIFKDGYNSSEQELVDVVANGNSMWLSVGGVCGWSTKGINVKFSKIELNNFTVNGSNFVGGLLGYSGNSSTTDKILVDQCSATDISVKMTSASKVGDERQSRNGIGSFVGKVQEGAVVIYGTDKGTENTDLSKYSEVKIKSFGFGNDELQYYTSAGGLVGFAGHCCQAYDMIVTSSDDTVTIGNSKVRFSGGIVGGMQSFNDSVTEITGVAKFVNCTVEDIDVEGEYAGGFYGGKWDSAWTPYSITFDNCKVIGKSADDKNNISASYISWDRGNNYKNELPCAGGFVGRGLVKTSANSGDANILIKDCVVSNYSITAEQNGTNKGFSGGFVGYCSSNANNSVITCYIHDCAVENSVVGAQGAYSYGGGAIGWVKPKNTSESESVASNKLLGYNIKLDNVTTNSGDNMGAWIGYKDTGKVSIQFSGMAIYGQGYKNVGNNATLGTAAFVFADYDGACKKMTDDAEELAVPNTTKVPENKATFNIGNDVEMPKYPYVNVNPQSRMGVREDNSNAVISGDGAVLLNSLEPTYSIYTSGQTMAAKLYADIKAGTNSRRYTTCENLLKNEVIADGHKFEYYLERRVSDDGDRISTYKKEKGVLPQGIDDFTCIMISTADPDETTNLINQYIRLLTNTTNDYATVDDYYSVDIKTCKLIEDDDTDTAEFKLITDSNDPDYAPGIVHEDNKFKMTEVKSNADSNKENTFTLIDVQFKDPLNKEKVAYHLYVPVYTSVQLEVNFYAAVKTGSNSISYQTDGITVKNSDYETLMDPDTYPEYIHIDNLNSWYTMYFRYSYSKSDLEAMLDAGNLNWNHEKYVLLTKIETDITHMLPENTFMTLIDPNAGSDKIYYAHRLSQADFPRETFTENNKQKVRLKLDFKKFKGVDNQPFKVASLNEMIAQNLESVPVQDSGLYDFVGENKPADFDDVSYVYVMDNAGNKTYYRHNPDHNGAYNLQFKAGFEELHEDYYLNVYVPEENLSTIYGYDISIDKKFPAPSAAGTNAQPKSANVVTGYTSRLVYLGDLYDQNVTFEVRTSDQVVTGSNKTLDAYAKTEINAKSVPILGILASAKNYTSLFHSYVLTLDRHGENGEIMTQIYGLDQKDNGDPRVEAWYSFESPISDSEEPTEDEVNHVDVQSNYINVTTVKDTDDLIGKIAPNVNDITTVTIYSRIRMDFDEMRLEAEFPQKTRSDAGVSARVSSNLAYETSGLAFSSSSISANDRLNHLYYRASMDSANLYYKALTPNLDKYDYDGEYSENYTRVGVNGRRSMSEYMPIDTVANYDLSKVSQSWNEAESVQLILSLQKKTDIIEDNKVIKVQYADVSDITQYWGGLELTADGKPKETIAENSGTTMYRLTPTEGTSVWIESKDYKQLISVNSNESTITVDIPKEQADFDASTDTVEIHISFVAKTGALINDYANFKVNLTAHLLDDSGGVIEACNAPDYMIYTNAKVSNEFLTEE